MRRLRDEGVAIIYISHRLNEVFGLANRLVVLRDRVVALETEPAMSTEREVVAAMVGRTVENFYPKEHNATDRVVLQLKGFSSTGRFSDVDLQVHAGEVLEIGGVQGCGKGSLLRSLYGLLAVSEGEALLDDVVFRPATPRAAIAAGICYLTPDRQREGLALQQSIAANLSMATLGAISSAGLVNAQAEQARGEKMRKELDIKAKSVRSPVSALSGGNQQKVLLGRWLSRLRLARTVMKGLKARPKTGLFAMVRATRPS